MNIEELKKELRLSQKDLAQFFDLTYGAFANSSAKDRYENALCSFYEVAKKAWEEKNKIKRLEALNFIEMKNRCEARVRPEVLNNTQVNDEYLFRDLARKMVSEMPLDELHKLINFAKIDPNSSESEKVLRESMDRFKIEQIRQLRNDRVILYSAKVDLP